MREDNHTNKDVYRQENDLENQYNTALLNQTQITCRDLIDVQCLPHGDAAVYQIACKKAPLCYLSEAASATNIILPAICFTLADEICSLNKKEIHGFTTGGILSILLIISGVFLLGKTLHSFFWKRETRQEDKDNLTTIATQLDIPLENKTDHEILNQFQKKSRDLQRWQENNLALCMGSVEPAENKECALHHSFFKSPTFERNVLKEIFAFNSPIPEVKR